jgi:TP901 family phage tail tape measure protein
MARFAEQANAAAKRLSTTTNEFAKASLIFYQQGDSAELAAKKAEITTKAANIAFTASAQEMSQMLTAVWNSFQMGEDQLEHAVDVMAKLGANTASSMEEMAKAMQKVAATANTVGISMDQMSAIVATAASVTRQAPETIGTAWNTVLGRISNLKLGETLEDGVDLTKYTKALQSIGVSVLDANGELREMGAVVDEIGEKWQTLTSAQKSALAATIGGVRQYTQINAFFENFDKYQKNMK